MYVHTGGCLIVEDDMFAEHECYDFVKFEYGSESPHEKPPEWIVRVQSVIYDLVIIDFLLVMGF